MTTTINNKSYFYGSFLEAIEILDRIQQNATKNYVAELRQSEINQAKLDLISEHIRSIGCCIDALSVANENYRAQEQEYQSQFFNCAECGDLRPVNTDLVALEHHGSVKELCKRCNNRLTISN